MSDRVPSDWCALRGNSYPVKEELKQLGARWDRETGLWWVPPEKLSEAQALIDDGGRR
jgi:hypothetical protein